MSYEATNERKPGEDMVAYETRLVRDIGTRIGYGRTIQLCERLWGELLPGGVSPAAYAYERLKAYDKREPLVEALIEETGRAVHVLIHEGSPHTGNTLRERANAVEDFCITPASTDVASEANAAGSGGSEPTK